MSSGDLRTPVSAFDRQLWVESVVRSRTAARALALVGDPMPGSPLAVDNDGYPTDYLSDAVHGYLLASTDHLMLWSNVVAPVRFIEGAEVSNPSRPYFSLARAAIEAASQAVWVMQGESSEERIERHLRLVADSLGQMRIVASRIDAAAASETQTRIDAIAVRTGAPVKGAPNFIDMVRHASPAVGLSENDGEILWRTAAAAAHGKPWFIDATHVTEIRDEYAPGHFRAVRRPDPGTISAMVEFASRLAQRGVLRYAELAGYDYESIFSTAFESVRADSPQALTVNTEPNSP